MFNRRSRFRHVLDQQPEYRSPLESLESRQLFSATAISSLTVEPSIIESSVTQGSVIGYTAAELKAAYGITGTGAGQTIAIIDAYNDPNLSSDLAVFDKAMGLSSASLTVESQTGSTTSLPSSNASWALETSLDVEWAHAVAPSAKILLVEASNSSLGDLLTAVNTARDTAGVSVVSMSWGSSEFLGETSYDSYFTTPSGHTNITFVASSGDDSYVEWPSASSNVVAVGGTTLTVSSSGTYETEVGWHESGGGYSVFEGEPAYQSSVQSTGERSTPDVSYDANPSTGVAVYDSVTYDGESGWFEIGGTSAGAPQWSGIVAIADQSRASSGKTLLTSAGVLNALYSTYKTSTYSVDFHDITSGTSSSKSASTGYDLLTGLGTPKASAVDSTLGSFTGSETTTVTTRTPPRPIPLGPAFGRAISIASTANAATFESDAAAFDSSATASFSSQPFLDVVDRLNRAIAELTMPASSDGTLAWTGSVQPSTTAAAWLAGSENQSGDSIYSSTASPAANGTMAIAAANVPTHLDGVSAGAAASPGTPGAGSIWTIAASAFDYSALGRAATHFGSSLLSTLQDPSARSFETAAAAAIAGAGFLWWWTEPQREEDRKRATSADTEVFCRKLIEVTRGSHGIFA